MDTLLPDPERSASDLSDPETPARPGEEGAAEAAAEETGTSRGRARRSPVLDAVGAAAVEQARAALLECTPERLVGEHLGVVAEDERVVSHLFACTDVAYLGWQWSVTLARAPRARQATVNEVVLLPGQEALLAPEWLPWSERLRPGDLGIGDLLPTAADDLRLAPGYAPEADEWDDALLDEHAQWELGLGRQRVLSVDGRLEAAQRWYDGASGPQAPIAEVAPAQCASCGFFVALSGSLGATFGVCANEYAPDDAKVVTVDHGCGAHSEAAVLPAPVTSAPVVDDLGFDYVDRELPSASTDDPVAEPEASGVAPEEPAATSPVVGGENAVNLPAGVSAESGEPAGATSDSIDAAVSETPVEDDAERAGGTVRAEEPSEDFGHS